jgi:hypothetical protein
VPVYRPETVVRAFGDAGISLQQLVPAGRPSEWPSAYVSEYYVGAVGDSHLHALLLRRDDVSISRGYFGEPEHVEQKFQRANLVVFLDGADSGAALRVQRALDLLDREGPAATA